MGLIQKIKEFFKKPKKENVKDFRSLKKQAVNELDKLKKEKFHEKSLEELNRIFRIFINERYELKRSLTYEELKKDIVPLKIDEGIKKKIIEVAFKIHQSTYKTNPKKKTNNFDSLLEEIEEIIKNS